MEKLASSLPLHLIAVLLSGSDSAHLTHMLRGVRLLHSFSDLASRHSRLEQVHSHTISDLSQLMSYNCKHKFC